MDQRSAPHGMHADDEPIIDLKHIGYYAGYVLRSMKRRRSLLVLTFLCTAGLVGGLCIVLPRVYKISTRILTHRSLVMRSLVNPDSTVPQAADAPTAGAVELIKSRENIENLMTDIKLQDVWEAKRSLLWKLKDRAFAAALGKPSDQDMHEAFLKMLDERLTANVENEVVVMDVEWPDPDIAMSLSEGAVARFLKLRRDMELAEILETVNILERNVDSSRQGIEQLVGRMSKIVNDKERELEGRGGRSGRKAKRTRVIAIRRPVGAEQADPGADDLRRGLNDKQASIAQLKRAYQVRVKKAEDDLATLRTQLGPEHPDVVEAKRAVESLKNPPPELVAMQGEEARLAAQLSTMPQSGGKDEPKVQVQNGAADGSDVDMMRVPVSDELFSQMDKDPEIASVMEELKKREDAHDDLLQRLANARIESETANVAFEYRYIMTMPPVYPKKAVKPNMPLMIVGGLVVALLLGVVFAVAADVLSKRVLEPWQLERFLNLRVLGEADES